MVIFLKGEGEPIVDPSQYEVMKNKLAITKAMSDEELSARSLCIFSCKIIHTELVSVSELFPAIRCISLCSLPQEDASIRAKTKTIHKYEWFFYDYIQYTDYFFTFKKMETVYIKTPLGIAAITGDVNGVLK
jgi:hypothetical protein